MDRDGLRPAFAGLILVSAALCFAAAACSDIHPEANNEGGGLLEPPTQEQDTFHQTEQHQEQHR
jgi:hypothetical protein